MRGILWTVVAGAAVACGSVKHGGADAAPGEFQLTAAPASALVRQGASVDVDVTAERGEVGGDIAVTAGGLPDGVTAEPLTIPDGETSGVLTLEAAGDAAQGEAAVTLTGEATAGDAAGELRLLVGGEPGSFDLSFAD